MYGKLGHGKEAGCSTPKRVEGLVGLPVGLVRLSLCLCLVCVFLCLFMFL
jgi:hypothetical protein